MWVKGGIFQWNDRFTLQLQQLGLKNWTGFKDKVKWCDEGRQQRKSKSGMLYLWGNVSKGLENHVQYVRHEIYSNSHQAAVNISYIAIKK